MRVASARCVCACMMLGRCLGLSLKTPPIDAAAIRHLHEELSLQDSEDLLLNCRSFGPHGMDAMANASTLVADFRVLQAQLPPPITLEKHVPIRHLHIPKTGVSFMLTLLDYACPGVDWFSRRKGWRVDKIRPTEDDSKNCAHDMWPNRTQTHWGWFGESRSTVAAFTMLRDPRKRRISAMKYFALSGNETECEHHKQCHRGLQAEYILNSGLNHWTSSEDAIASGVAKAIDTVRNDFMFVGLTDDWDVSMILFRAMFGGDLKEQDLRNVHNSRYSQATYDACNEVIGSTFKDPYDEPIVAAAEKLMKQRIQERFGQACLQAPRNAVCEVLDGWLG